MDGLKQSGAFTIEPAPLASIRAEFGAGRSTMDETAATIRKQLAASGYLLDPHTATAVHVADSIEVSATPQIVLGTAHPAKFPAAVKEAAGIEPQLPSWLSDLMARKEKFTVLPSSIKMVEDYIGRHSRAAS
jgi:threonine synthase